MWQLLSGQKFKCFTSYYEYVTTFQGSCRSCNTGSSRDVTSSPVTFGFVHVACMFKPCVQRSVHKIHMALRLIYNILISVTIHLAYLFLSHQVFKVLILFAMYRQCVSYSFAIVYFSLCVGNIPYTDTLQNCEVYFYTNLVV